jgi:hypothetical protein
MILPRLRARTAVMRLLALFLFAVISVFVHVPAWADEPALSKIEPLTISTDSDASMFTVEIADTDALRAKGLMFRQRLPEDRGMLFDFGKPRPVSMWMKNTYISLDMLFIRADGTIAYIAENTKPQSLDVIGLSEPMLAVLELAGGTTRRLGIRAGDTVHHRIFEAAP